MGTTLWLTVQRPPSGVIRFAKFDFTELGGKEKWTTYIFTKNVYEIWMPTHFKRISSAIDELPPDLDFELSQQSDLQSSEPSGLSQQFEGQLLAEESSRVDLQQITPDTSTQSEKPASKKRGRMSDSGAGDCRHEE